MRQAWKLLFCEHKLRCCRNIVCRVLCVEVNKWHVIDLPPTLLTIDPRPPPKKKKTQKQAVHTMALKWPYGSAPNALCAIVLRCCVADPVKVRWCGPCTKELLNVFEVYIEKYSCFEDVTLTERQRLDFWLADARALFGCFCIMDWHLTLPLWSLMPLAQSKLV
jgi:hypothetical protein